MSKNMTPCEKLGYKVGDDFEVIEDSTYFKKGEIVSLHIVDKSSCPFFINEKVVRDGYSNGCAMYLSSVKKISKLKPAKQALADAIHQNGGWSDFDDSLYATMEKSSSVSFYANKPYRSDEFWFGTLSDESFKAGVIIPNWHQTILSRDEYFTAYPEQVNIEVNNETERKVEVEMKSESEVTIKVGDWHKNGELPPVGEVCEMIDGDGAWRVVEVIALHAGFAHGWDSSKVISYFSDDKSEFRPIRTERDKAIEEMVRAMAGDGVERLCMVECATRLYEEGYRKEAK